MNIKVHWVLHVVIRLSIKFLTVMFITLLSDFLSDCKLLYMNIIIFSGALCLFSLCKSFSFIISVIDLYNNFHV